MIEESIAAAKDEVRGEVMVDLEFRERSCNLKTLSETEELDTYNRRDNIRITGIEEQNGQAFAGCTTKTVVEIGRAIDCGVQLASTIERTRTKANYCEIQSAYCKS